MKLKNIFQTMGGSDIFAELEFAISFLKNLKKIQENDRNYKDFFLIGL